MSVIWMPRARASLWAILEHIALDDLDAAHRLVDEIVDGTEATIGAHPNAGRPGRVGGTREWVAHRNYIVAYRVNDARDVQVLDVVHSAKLWPQNF